MVMDLLRPHAGDLIHEAHLLNSLLRLCIDVSPSSASVESPEQRIELLVELLTALISALVSSLASSMRALRPSQCSAMSTKPTGSPDHGGDFSEFVVVLQTESTPYLLVVRHAHWMDDGSWRTIKLVAESVTTVAVLLSKRPLQEPSASCLELRHRWGWLSLECVSVMLL